MVRSGKNKALPSGPEPDARPSGSGRGCFLRFYCKGDLGRKTRALLDRMEAAEDPVQHREALADAVVALTSQGLDAYFMDPLKRAKAGFVTQQSASLGLAGARQVMGSVIRTLIVRMDGPQLKSVCASIRDFMS